jgi:hypothetical protein
MVETRLAKPCVGPLVAALMLAVLTETVRAQETKTGTETPAAEERAQTKRAAG